jgi:dihydroorotate dehydrogenase (NAD+) catalytic subunit
MLTLKSGLVFMGLSLLPSSGNPPVRIVETPCGMLNAIGLENIGVEAFVADKLPLLAPFNTPVIANIYGKTVDEYAKLASRLDCEKGVAALEVNISCPNVKAGGVVFGTDPKAASAVIAAVRRSTGKPVIAKLSPNVSSIVEIAKAVEDAGADAVSLINTITGMAVDLERRRPVLHNITGGLSGPAIKPVGLRMVWQAAGAVNIPVIGLGGISNARDALEYMLVGASAIQVGTANFVAPTVCIDIINGIRAFCVENKIEKISCFVGSLELN